jgi:two-component system response regulator RegA
MTLRRVVAGQSAARPHAGRAAILGGVESANEAGSRLLVVEDDDALRGLLLRSLRHRGFSTIGAASYEEAMRHLAASTPVYAVVDLWLPTRSGLDLVEEIRRVSPGTRVVAMSGVSGPGAAAESLRRGAARFLAKPVDADQIVEALMGPTTSECH